MNSLAKKMVKKYGREEAFNKALHKRDLEPKSSKSIDFWDGIVGEILKKTRK